MIVARHKFQQDLTIDGVNYTSGQVLEFDQISLYMAFIDKLQDVITPDEDKGTDPLIDKIKERELACKELYYRVMARQIKGGLLSQSITKQRAVDAAMAPFMIPLYMGRVVAAIEGIRAVTATTITNQSPFITAAGLLKLRNELHKIINIPLANAYNDAL